MFLKQVRIHNICTYFSFLRITWPSNKLKYFNIFCNVNPDFLSQICSKKNIEVLDLITLRAFVIRFVCFAPEALSSFWFIFDSWKRQRSLQLQRSNASVCWLNTSLKFYALFNCSFVKIQSVSWRIVWTAGLTPQGCDIFHSYHHP